MKKLFDHLYYRFYWWDTKIVKDIIPFTSSSISVTAFKILNVMIIFFIFFYFFDLTYKYGQWILFSAGTIIFSSDLYYYVYKKNYERIIEEKSNLPKSRLFKMDLVIITYMVFSIGLFILFLLRVR